MICDVPITVYFVLLTLSVKKCIQSNNVTILDQGTPIKTSLVANIGAAYYIINFFSYRKLNIHNKVIHDHARMSL